MLLFGLSGLIVVNVVQSRALFAGYRHAYGAPRNELLHHARRWHDDNPTSTFFVVSATCPGNAALPWFGAPVRGGHVKFSFIDALYPRTFLERESWRGMDSSRSRETALMRARAYWAGQLVGAGQMRH